MTHIPSTLEPHTTPGAQPVPAADSPRRRILTATAFVGSWIVLGMLVDPMWPVEYPLIGIPLGVVFQLLVRRRPLLELWGRDEGRPNRGRGERAAVAALALVLTLSWCWLYLPPDAISWGDTVWITTIFVVLAVTGRLLLGRVMVAAALALLLVTGLLWWVSPRPASQHTGDPDLLARMAMFDGYRKLSVAMIDLDAAQPVRFANVGSTPDDRFEIGSISKALTGLVITDSVARGELRLDDQVADHLPLQGSAAGAATLRQLVTHHAGYPAVDAATVRRAIWGMPLGRDWFDTSRAQLLAETRNVRPAAHSFVYSNLGAAVAGEATAAAAHLDYADLMRTRLFEPVGMTRTTVQTTPVVPKGHSPIGRSVEPWAMHGYASAGAVVSTTRDVSLLAVAMLNGTSPGMAATTPIANTESDNTRVGTFWMTTHWQNGQTITWHSGGTAGYSSYLALDREHRKAVIALSDTGVGDLIMDIGTDLLADRTPGRS